MKWFTIIVTLIVAGAICYTLFFQKPPANTPHATADAYIEAVLANDASRIRALCVESAAFDAESVAEQLRSASLSRHSLSFKAMEASETDPSRRGLIAMFSGRLLAIEFAEKEGEWKIVTITLSG